MSAPLKDRLETILIKGLENAQTDLETLPDGHVCGHVVSPEFERLDFEERRKRIRALLDQAATDGNLHQSELLQVSTLLTYTPAEWSTATSDLGSGTA